MNDGKFNNGSFVIFGGSSGIGLAAAEALAMKNAQVTIVSRDKEKLKVANNKGIFHTHILDIANENEIRNFFESKQLWDGIVCTAGESSPGPLATTDSSVVRQGFESKFIGQFNIVKYGHVKLKEHGSFVLTGGVFSQRPRRGVGLPAAINGAIESFVKAMAVELAPLRINAFAPGYIETPRLNKVAFANNERFQSEIDREVPLKRIGRKEESAESILYLLSNGYTTGSTLYLDGGIGLR